jgi:hypothetical protein
MEQQHRGIVNNHVGEQQRGVTSREPRKGATSEEQRPKATSEDSPC